MRYEKMQEETYVQAAPQLAAFLPFGEGAIGRNNALQNEAEKQEFASSLGQYTVTCTKLNTADCVDERPTLGFADGTNNPDIVDHRVAPQLPGGLGLATTKALVAADALIVRDAKDFKDAYIKTVEVLTQIGFEDGGHVGCGASKLVEASVASKIEDNSLLQVVELLAPGNEQAAELHALNMGLARQRLEEGFYGAWDNSWHEAYLSENAPQNFAVLKSDPADLITQGHHGSGLYVTKQADAGFSKNRFVSGTGKQAFCYSAGFADQLAFKLGIDNEERARIQLGFALDAPSVLNKLVIEGFPVFAQN